MKENSVREKRILITGASGGIGHAIASSLTEVNSRIVLHYHSNEAGAKELQRQVELVGAEVEIVQADLSTKEGRCALISEVDKIMGYCDILINNAGNSYAKKVFDDMNEDDVESALGLNFKAAFFLCRRYFPEMCKRRYGRIINMSTISVKFGGGERSLAYAASKSALEILTRNLAKRGAECNVLVNAVRPGVIDTDFHRINPKDMCERVSMIPMKRMGRPSEVADLVRYLVGDGASFTTGEVLAVAGGE